MNKLHLCLIAAMALTACTEDDETLKGSGVIEGTIMPTEKPNDVITEGIFEKLNLDYPGLEKVKAYHEAGQDYYACYELLQYYRNRSNVINPSIDLINTSYSAAEKAMADQALLHQFYVRGFSADLGADKKQGTSDDTFYKFEKKDENGQTVIDWDLQVEGVTSAEFKYQRHRWQWMEPQAKTYRVTKNEDYIKNWIETYQSWMDTYPCPNVKFDDNETNKDSNYQWKGLQTAERLLSQLNVMQYYLQSTNFTPEWLSTFLISIADHVEMIRKNYYQTPGDNIRLSQIQAVFTAGVLMPEFKNATEWANEASTILDTEIGSQFLEDGVHADLDPSYHIGSVSNCLSLYYLLSLNDKTDLLPASFISKLKNATNFLKDIIYPNYTIDNYNDTRSDRLGKSIQIKNFKKYSEIYPDDEEMKYMAYERAKGTVPSYTTKAYSAAGYYMLRSGWTENSTMMVLKNNYNPEAKWHCQPDNQTFSLYRNGRIFFPDAGCHGYEGDPLRKDFAAAVNHNTLTALSKDPDATHRKGEFLTMYTEKMSSVNVDVLSTQFEMKEGLTHRRTVFFVNKAFFVIADEAFGDGNKDKVNLNFHMITTDECPTVADADADKKTAGLHTTFTDGNNMVLRSFYAEGSTTGALEGKIDNKETEVWNNTADAISKASGKRLGMKFNVRKPINGASRLITIIKPIDGAYDANMELDAKFTDNTEETRNTFHADGVTLQVTVDGKTYNLQAKIK